MIAGAETIGSRVHAARVEAGMSQAELACLAGLDERTVENIEAGRRAPSLPMAVALANALRVTFASLTVE